MFSKPEEKFPEVRCTWTDFCLEGTLLQFFERKFPTMILFYHATHNMLLPVHLPYMLQQVRGKRIPLKI
jgi:hypothetical protein